MIDGIEATRTTNIIGARPWYRICSCCVPGTVSKRSLAEIWIWSWLAGMVGDSSPRLFPLLIYTHYHTELLGFSGKPPKVMPDLSAQNDRFFPEDTVRSNQPMIDVYPCSSSPHTGIAPRHFISTSTSQSGHRHVLLNFFPPSDLPSCRLRSI